jgi:NADH pyrophosphatase NudC (nudix superfamily)
VQATFLILGLYKLSFSIQHGHILNLELINILSQGKTMGENVKPETICGYCSQGKHYECRGYDCECAKTGHS